jgi:bromodomain-containing protein 8
MDGAAITAQYTTQEKLLLAQAIYKLGAVQWPVISQMLIDHPCCAGRSGELFSPEACEAAYVNLMAAAGMNVYVHFPTSFIDGVRLM